jgi:hypothetical protein
LWLALALPPLVVVVAIHGLDVDLGAILTDRRLVIEQAATLATALSAAVAAFALTVPGADRKWLWLPAIPLAIWLATLGKGCLDDWLTYGAAGLRLRPDFDCLLPMIAIGAIPAIAMIVMLRRGAPLYPRPSLALGTLATAAVANFGLRLFHIGDVSIMVLVWHFGYFLILVTVAGLAGPRVISWRANRLRLSR